MKRILIITGIWTVLMLAGSQASLGQMKRQLSLAAINESIAFPFTSYGEFHPGFELGVSIISREKEHSIRQVNAYAGWFLHQYIENGFFLRGEYSYKLKLGEAFTVGIYGGAGYLHTFYPGTLYQIDEVTGEINSVRQFGRPRIMLSTGIQISYRSPVGIEPFLKQEFAVETPFANGIPVMPHSFLKLGINVNL